MESSMELDLNIALPSDEQLSQEKLLPIKTLRDFDLNVTPHEVENEMNIQSSLTEWNYSDHQASQILTQVQASPVGGNYPKQAPDFAAALAKAARVYNKVEISSDPEPKSKRLVKIAPKPPSMPNELRQSYVLGQPFRLQQYPSSSTDHNHSLESQKPIGVLGTGAKYSRFRQGYWPELG